MNAVQLIMCMLSTVVLRYQQMHGKVDLPTPQLKPGNRVPFSSLTAEPGIVTLQLDTQSAGWWG